MASFSLPRHTSLTCLRHFSPVSRPPTVHHAGGSNASKAQGRSDGDRDTLHHPTQVLCKAAPQTPQQSTKEELKRAGESSRPVAPSASAADAKTSGEFERLYDRETPFINTMLEEIDAEGMVNDQVERISGEPTTEEEKREVVTAVVDKYFDEMSEGIIVVLAGYAQAAWGAGHNKVAETLEMIREAILNKSMTNLPPELQALDYLISSFESSREERVAAAKEMGTSGHGSVPHLNLGALRTTASQLIEDMEEKGTIIDRKLLARLCMVREEVDMAAAALGLLVSGSEYHQLMSATWRLLPLGPAAFIKELISVSSPEKRRALLERCIRDDWQGYANDKADERWLKQGVRPGRLLNTISALQTGLAEQGLKPDSQEITRLHQIKAEAYLILMNLT